MKNFFEFSAEEMAELRMALMNRINKMEKELTYCPVEVEDSLRKSIEMAKKLQTRFEYDIRRRV